MMGPVLTLVVVVVLSVVGVLVIHEAGHALAAWGLGGRRVRLVLRPWGAAIEAELPVDSPGIPGPAKPGQPTASHPGRGALAFVLAGPLASALVGAGMLVAGGILVVPGALSVAFALLCLVPHGTSDGARALSLVRSRSLPRG